MPTSRVLFWHRRDLRLADNLGLVAALAIFFTPIREVGPQFDSKGPPEFQK